MEKTVEITLTVAEVNLVLGALQELPHKVSDVLIRNIMEQGQRQTQEAAPAEAPAETPAGE